MLYPLSYEGNENPVYPRDARPASRSAHNGIMTVFIDPPRWPAHGTWFSHLVSDRSVTQLHEFATGLGISPRAFDLDHYDVPAHRYGDALAAGAMAVEGKELVGILTASGLRVPARRRPERLALTLRRRWLYRFPELGRLGDELVGRWGEPHRDYHGPEHLLRVLEALDELTEPGAHPRLVAAAWFHDAVHRGVAGEDEEASAALAFDRLTAAGWSAADSRSVAELVLVTKDHVAAGAGAEAELLVDADLSILGADEQGYDRYARAVRREYSAVPDEVFRPARAGVLEGLLAKPTVFHTEGGRARWETGARQNLRAEIGRLRG